MSHPTRKRRTSSPEAKPRRSRPGYDPRSVRDLTRGAAALHLYLTATRGSAARLAARLDVSEMIVSMWHRGLRIPREEMRVALAAETRGAVAVEAWRTTVGASELLAAARHIESEREAAECAMQTGGAS
jgi:DNA-binding transcriptional regulator YdaS (Cro superfamily)